MTGIWKHLRQVVFAEDSLETTCLSLIILWPHLPQWKKDVGKRRDPVLSVQSHSAFWFYSSLVASGLLLHQWQPVPRFASRSPFLLFSADTWLWRPRPPTSLSSPCKATTAWCRGPSLSACHRYGLKPWDRTGVGLGPGMHKRVLYHSLIFMRN